MRWGFVSPTARDPKLALINARAESLSTSPMFRDAFRRHRCLVVADGFYEWKRDRRTKTPFFIRLRSSRPFGFAGIWSLTRSCVALIGQSNARGHRLLLCQRVPLAEGSNRGTKRSLVSNPRESHHIARSAS